MNEKKIFTENELGIVSDTITDDLQKDLTVHQKASLFDEQNKFFEGFGYKDTQGFIDQCNQGKITVSTTINKLKDVNLELEKEIERLKKIERKFQHQNENFQFMGFDSVSDFLHQWIDQDKITVIRDNPHYDLVEEINKLRTDKFDLEKIETQFNLQNEKFQLMGFDDANDFLDQWLEDHKIEIVIDPDTVSHNNVNKYKAENFELKNKCNKLEKDIERLENQFNIQNYNKSVTSLNIKLKEEIKNLKAENVDLLSQINNLKKKNKQLCKDADTFLKKKDPASKMYQDLEFIKNLINTLQKEYNKSESKNGIID